MKENKHHTLYIISNTTVQIEIDICNTQAVKVKACQAN